MTAGYIQTGCGSHGLRVTDPRTGARRRHRTRVPVPWAMAATTPERSRGARKPAPESDGEVRARGGLRPRRAEDARQIMPGGHQVGGRMRFRQFIAAMIDQRRTKPATPPDEWADWQLKERTIRGQPTGIEPAQSTWKARRSAVRDCPIVPLTCVYAMGILTVAPWDCPWSSTAKDTTGTRDPLSAGCSRPGLAPSICSVPPTSRQTAATITTTTTTPSNVALITAA